MTKPKDPLLGNGSYNQLKSEQICPLILEQLGF